VWVLAACSTWAAIVWPPAIVGFVALLVVSSLFMVLCLRPAKPVREPREDPPRLQPAQAPEHRESAPVHYPLLRPEDEAEVERLYQRLKAVGRLDSRSSSDEI